MSGTLRRLPVCSREHDAAGAQQQGAEQAKTGHRFNLCRHGNQQQTEKQDPGQPARQPARIRLRDLQHRHDLIRDTDDQDQNPADQAPGGMQRSQFSDRRDWPQAGKSAGQQDAEQQGDDQRQRSLADWRGNQRRGGFDQAEADGEAERNQTGGQNPHAGIEPERFAKQETECQAGRADTQSKQAEPANQADRRHRCAEDYRQHLQQGTQHHHGQVTQGDQMRQRQADW
jgi:hypothetical protein